MTTDAENKITGKGAVGATFGRACLPTDSEIELDLASLAPDGSAEVVLAPLTFNADSYRHYLEGGDLTEAEAKELLESIWSIVVGFVDLAYGEHPIQQAMDKSKVIEGSLAPGFAAVVSSLAGNSATKTPTGEARDRRVKREGGIHEPH